ncbi:MAG: hypothetical protein HZB16_02340 [Armatimonadetes bacterium]|nr:hypothetical protein [Armatimonadota bacterium]
MKLQRPSLRKLADMICGNGEGTPFPYRTSSQLTVFFTDCDLDMVHDGSTRAGWVLDQLLALNASGSDRDPLPAPALRRVIEHLMSPLQWSSQESERRPEAIKAVQELLVKHGLAVSDDPATGEPLLLSTSSAACATAAGGRAAPRHLICRPTAFAAPEHDVVSADLVTVMMPFGQGFDAVYETIRSACSDAGFDCKRADDVWQSESILQDVFDLILSAAVVVVDWTGRNPNVMYETGIAHTIGKAVVPIAQHPSDAPTDLSNHRYLRYLSNQEGLANLRQRLAARLATLRGDA